MLTAAKYYFDLGLSIIPIKKNKKPFLSSWSEYQEKKPTEDEVMEWWSKKYPGANIGGVCGKISDRMAVDIDNYKNPDAMDILEEHFSELFVTQISETPRGGEHWHFKYDPNIGNMQLSEGIDIKSHGSYIIMPPSVGENGNSYSWKKGFSIVEVQLAIINNSFKHYLLNYITNTSLYSRGEANNRHPVTSGQHPVTSSNRLFTEGSRDNDLFHAANCLIKGGMRNEVVLQVLEILAKSCVPPFSEKEVSVKLQSALKRSEVKKQSVAEEVREFITVTNGTFRVSDLERWVTGGNKDSNKAILIALSRMVKEESPVIERIENKSGWYRKLDGQFEIINLDNVEDGKVFNLTLPLGIHKYLEIMPKDLIVFAGVPNSGKTAVLLETLRINMGQFKCFYFSSEMGKHNCKKRISKSTATEKWDFKFIEDFPNFIDIIQPDDLNFIDYIEETEGEAYKIPGLLAKIQKRLKKGVAIVALQKNPDKSYAIGGHQTKAKPALFCTIDPKYPGALMRIVKAKNYKDENPNGYIRDFKIVNGINIIPGGVWQPE